MKKMDTPELSWIGPRILSKTLFLKNSGPRLKNSLLKTAVLLMAALALARPALLCAFDGITPQEAANIAVDAYIYAYPLVTMEMTRRVMTNVAEPEGKSAPMGQFAKLRTYPGPEDKEVTAPNADTLYTIAWVDVSKEPWVVTIPDMRGRYYLMPLLNAWTEVFEDPGSRTTGGGFQKYAITGPSWSGTLPNGITEYRSATSLVWILGRIYSTGTPEDLAAVHNLQDQFTLGPLSAYQKPYSPAPGTVDPSVDMKTPVRDQVNRMDPIDYFRLFASLLKANPPTPSDAPMLDELAKLGIAPGVDFDPSKASPATLAALRAARKPALERILAFGKKFGPGENGWMYSLNLGRYGADYLLRATTAALGLGANLPQDAIYPVSRADATGHPYSGTHDYLLHFENGQLPPVKGFWSLTMYSDQLFFVPNPLNRYKLGSASNFIYNTDGSLDLYMQKNSPGTEKEPNWLPAPAGPFVLMLRLYWPNTADPTILNGTWRIPPVHQVR